MNMDNSGYSVEQIAKIIGGKHIGSNSQARITNLLTDSRKVLHPFHSLFFALLGERHDGHEYIPELYDKGVRNFVISSQAKNADDFPEANFIRVANTLNGLQSLCAYHREQFDIPVIGITGSNGKTIVKEWLHQLLNEDKNIIKSPKSYNSQLGVPLSVWLINPNHDLAIFEAGISMPGEMESLEKIIHPSIGIFTNIGDAHNEGFENKAQKANEKLKLFFNSTALIYRKDYRKIEEAIVKSVALQANKKLKLFSWALNTIADLKIDSIIRQMADERTVVKGIYKRVSCTIEIPFTDDASVENAIHCWALMLFWDYPNEVIAERIISLAPVAMRMELKEGINNCIVINDTYNSDLVSLEIALDFLHQQKQFKKKTVILSDIFQSGKSEKELYQQVSELLSHKEIDRFMGIGEAVSRQSEQFKTGGSFYQSTEDFLRKFSPSLFNDEIILLKGARKFKFEQLSKALQQKAHETVLEINLDAIIHNLNIFRAKLSPETKIMAMVKAFSYGSGSYEIASVLQFHRVDYLAVAYADEGVELRKAGITVPIMVVNPEDQSYDAMVKYNLEPEIYNFHVLQQFISELNKRHNQQAGPKPVHIKLETGMHRLGFEENEIDELIEKIVNTNKIYVQSVFSHLAASENKEHDDFTRLQIKKFKLLSDRIIDALEYPVIRHILNSSGILRFPEAQFEMVRLGIGIYGVESLNSHGEPIGLQNVSTLKSTISQIKSVAANDTIGYGRKGKADQNIKIGVIPIGYADGLNRKLGNGKGKLLVNGHFVPIIGEVCMDMCMVDITHIPSHVGDEVIVFGAEYPVSEFAKNLGTIPYEALTSVSRRVKRVYYHE